MYGVRDLLEKTIQRPLGEKLCHEFISGVLQFISRGLPPSAGTMNNLPSGLNNIPFLQRVQTSHFPSGEILGNVLL